LGLNESTLEDDGVLTLPSKSTGADFFFFLQGESGREEQDVSER
jgi:hypothetical protein